VVIDAEFGKENYGSNSATAIGRRIEPLDGRNLRTRLNWW
jgi:hypothetical protein